MVKTKRLKLVKETVSFTIKLTEKEGNIRICIKIQESNSKKGSIKEKKKEYQRRDFIDSQGHLV